MANTLVTALGRANNVGATPLSLGADYDTRFATYLKLFSGELFKGFQHNTIARDLVTKRTLTNGKSMQFIYTGRMSADYHTPGTPILGSNEPPIAEKTINMDDLLIASAFVYELDETLAHYDLRSEISRKIGYALAEKYDRLIFRAIIRGAREDHPINAQGKVEPGGTQIQVGSSADKGTDADATDAGHLTEAFYKAATALDEKGVSGEGRVAVISPKQYYALIQGIGSNGLVNRDVQGTALQSGNGIVEIAGIKIYKSMNVPFLSKYGTTDVSGNFVGASIEPAKNSNNGINNEYGGANNFKKSCGIIFQREAAGVVEAIGPQVQVTNGDVSVMYQGDIILGRMAMGADYLNPAACVELTVQNPANTKSSDNDNNTEYTDNRKF